MKSNEVLYSKGKNDECITPDYAVIPLLKYIPKSWIIWCPFDKEDSAFVRIFKENGYSVIYSHIEYGQDFYTYEPSEHWDILISNPPFTNKRDIFVRAMSFKKPFALLMTNTWWNDSAPYHLFKDKSLNILSFNKRIKYKNNGVVNNKITFMSAYWGIGFLPKQIIFEELEEPKTKQPI